MTTTLDNNHRKFLVQSKGFTTTDIFCNLAAIPTVLKEAFEPNDEYVIYEYWNRKLKKATKKHINEMFEANQIDFKIN